MNSFASRRINHCVRLRALCAVFAGVVIASFGWQNDVSGEEAGRWHVGKPIVTYWAGPPLTEAVAAQLAEGGWNVVWGTEKDLETAAKHGLRLQLQDPL
ncbi:MAG TPA: hypothetical protein PKI05_07135, partial [Thermogutta sp.]|nr:hypothetical protein [Thermogutta sp.]